MRPRAEALSTLRARGVEVRGVRRHHAAGCCSRRLLDAELGKDDLAVGGVGRHELVVGAGANDAPGLEDDDPICRGG